MFKYECCTHCILYKIKTKQISHRKQANNRFENANNFPVDLTNFASNEYDLYSGRAILYIHKVFPLLRVVDLHYPS